MEAKLHPPLRTGSVSRTKLVRRLVASRRFPVVAIVAQVGYGKTTLLAQWQRRDDRPFAWVSVDDRDNEPAVLLSYIAAALDRIAPIDPAIVDVLASPGVSIWSGALPRIGAELLSLPAPVVIVLDDADVLRRRESLDTIVALAEHLGDGSQLVLSSRAQGNLPLAGLRASGRLFELGLKDLRMGNREARVLLRSAGVRVNEGEAAGLVGRTEGWAAGLYLAALSRQAAGGEAGGAHAFGGRDLFVADYLRDKQLSTLSRKKLQFLRRTSVLDRLSASFCDAVLERDDSARMLDSLERANAFLVPLDRQRDSYRYHFLYRELLRGELERREPHLVEELSRRAADWCEAHAEHEAAIDYAVRAGDLDRVARLVAAHALPLQDAGRLATVERWLGVFDDDRLLVRYPLVAMLGAWLHAVRGRAPLADRWGDLAEVGTFPEPLPDGSRTIEPWLAILRAARCRNGIEGMRADSELAVERLAPASRWLPTAGLLLGMSHLLADDDATADAVLARAVEAAEGASAPAPARLALAERALIALADGRAHEAEEFLERADGLDGGGLEDHGSSALVLAAAARSAVRQGDSARARDQLASAQRLRPQLGRAFPWLTTQTLLELTRVSLSLADVSAARALLTDADEMLRAGPDLGVLAGQARELRDQLSRSDEPQARWASTLTAAELRLLPLLTTHLSFREIAARLHVSRNTVKAQAISLYRKLHASSRSEALERAAELGLVDCPVVRPAGDFIPSG